MSRAKDKVVPIEQAEANLPATRGDLEKLEERITERLDDHSERLGKVEDLLIEINQKL